ncbi:MAG: DNA topoisomerase IV subunit A [Deltaproteobacteria bacterium]|nr:DNA topoisomerase IV subunit A [Deltaproteobacteria bacterium]
MATRGQLDLFPKPGKKINGKGGGAQGRPPASGGNAPGGGGPTDVALADEAQRRYLSYAVSVITSRALPDVRDGLKPVQRRILYTMFHELHLYPDSRFKKCAAVVGDVMGKYHPHGDTAIYDALVRMAQSFSLRMPLVAGQGNFGSLDADSPAAMRYTEARLAPAAMDLLEELRQDTVPRRANYDGTTTEPIVIPARLPNLLVNGCTGIAVGMATSIPPHNLGETIDALEALIADPKLGSKDLVKHIKGPDFPTGGQVLSTRRELAQIYETGSGSLKLRGEYKVEERDRGVRQIVVTSVPYGISKATIVEKIAEVIVGRKVPQLVDVRDESTTEVRIVLEIKREADPALVMAYLYKHTPLSTSFGVNLTCLLPTEKPEVQAPARIGLKEICRHFLDFRFEVVTRRFEFELAELRRRIHVLEGFEAIFDALDEAIRLIRKSDGKADSRAKLEKRFGLDELQSEAVVELKLYKLARLEIEAIRKELEEKRAAAKRIEAVLKSAKKRWEIISDELAAIKARYADKRRTRIVADDAPELDETAFIVEEDVHVILTRDGWVKRQREVKDPASTRLREGDEVLAVTAGSTKACLAFFSNHGSAYVTLFADVPATTGYGDPVQKLFKLEDGERIVGMLSLDPRLGDVPAATEGAPEPEPPHAVAVTKSGFGLRFSLRGHREPSTRSGRRFARPVQGDEVIAVMPAGGKEKLAVATAGGRAIVCEVSEVNLLAGAGKGVTVIKTDPEDPVIGAELLVTKHDALVVQSEGGRTFEITLGRYEVTARGGRGHVLLKRGRIVRWIPHEIVIPKLEPEEVN